ncbi:hypothetical protein [Streptomyces sp. DSM 40484]|uniref:hypothetical protein n=1 Tax=Streptomyces kroppenstedtii TaxID=3051181 RepID=UPI0028D44534|nr:hypothetical protein [Streptomyces sp. DSM 40484]
MGVFAWLLRKEGSESRGAEEAPAAEARTDSPEAGSGAEQGAEPVLEGTADAGPEAAVVDATAGAAEAADADAAAETGTGSEAGAGAAPSSASASVTAESGEAAAEAVEIPKQQSAAKAADSEVGENARQ